MVKHIYSFPLFNLTNFRINTFIDPEPICRLSVTADGDKMMQEHHLETVTIANFQVVTKYAKSVAPNDIFTTW